MRPIAIFVILLFVIFSSQTNGGDQETGYSVVAESQNYTSTGQPSDILTEYLAKESDIAASMEWHPDSKILLAPLSTIIETAYNDLKLPEGKSVYRKPKKFVQQKNPFSDLPDLRGIDLRRLSTDIWCWEVYFGLSLDRSIERQTLIRDGDIILSNKVLPNGGRIAVRERKMIPEERIKYGLDPDPNAKNDPFAP